MNWRCCSLILVFISGLLVTATSQTDNSKHTSYAAKLDSLAGNEPSELIYIQTSKDVFESGEDLWFKVYVVDARWLIPSDKSKTLYLQMLRADDKEAVWREKYGINNGFAAGHVYISPELPEGDYWLVAVTSYSLPEYPTEFRAVRRIKIRKDIMAPGQPVSTLSQKKTTERAGQQEISPEDTDTTAIQFNTFPEGGYLIAGIPGRVAFKAVNYKGIPVDVSGEVHEDGIPILEFTSQHAGMGSFTLMPLPGKKYSVHLNDPAIDTVWYVSGLRDSGISMNLEKRDAESLSFLIAQSQGIPAQDVFLVVQSRGVVYGTATGRLAGRLRIKMPLGGLPQGIAEVLLLDRDMMPLAARLVYVNPESRLNITSVLSEQVYPTRGKVTMKILTTGEDGQPVPANLGVTVFDKVFSNPLDSTNIVTHLHLSTQLKGRIYNPAYYFSSRNSERDNALDLLMLTQGWRSYVWNEIDLKEHSGGQHLVVNDDISGKLAVTKTSKKVSPDQTFVFAFSPNKGEERVLIETDSAGNFIIPSGLMKIWEGDYVYLKPFGPPDVKFDIEFTEPFELIGRTMERNEILDPIPGLMKAKPAPLLPFDYRVIKVPEVTVSGSGNSAIRGKYMGMLDSIAKFSKPDYVCRNDILNCINHPAEPDNRTPVEGELYKIASSNGATTSIIYKLPNYTEEELLKMNNLWRVKAYYLTREFYQPVYDRDDDTALSVPDFRNTLLWEPMVITDENGEATLEFFCSDINALFDIRIEGITGDGLIGAGYYRLIVTKQSGQSR